MSEHVKKNKEFYQYLFNHAEDIIFTVDTDGFITSINSYGALIFRRQQGELIGKTLADILPADTAEKQFRLIRDIFESGSSQQMTYTLSIDGKEHWLHTKLSPLHDEKGSTSAVLGITRDITHRKKIEDQEFFYYTEKLASLGVLAAGVAHEINNPLAIILGHTELLLDKVDKDSPLYKSLKTIERQGMNAKRIVEGLLNFASFSEKKLEWVDLNRSLETLLAVIGDSLLINKIKVKTDLAEDLPQIRGNQDELQQVVLNIINNAVHAMNGGGTLTIVTRALEDRQKVMLQISDTGHGIRKEILGRIFDPLFTTKKQGEGTGLGLSVSYGIIHKYGGTITCQSTSAEDAGEDRPSGTLFTILLPVSSEDETGDASGADSGDVRSALMQGLTRFSAWKVIKPAGRDDREGQQ